MTRVRCRQKVCPLNERGTCSAVEIELDRDGECMTAEESVEEELKEELVEAELEDKWEEEDEDWDEEE